MRHPDSRPPEWHLYFVAIRVIEPCVYLKANVNLVFILHFGVDAWKSELTCPPNAILYIVLKMTNAMLHSSAMTRCCSLASVFKLFLCNTLPSAKTTFSLATCLHLSIFSLHMALKHFSNLFNRVTRLINNLRSSSSTDWHKSK